MKPVLFYISDFSVHSYFFFLAIGFLIASLIGIVEFRKKGLPIKNFIDLAIIIVIFGMIGARLMHVVAEDIPHDVYCSKKLNRCGPDPNKLKKEGGDDVVKEFNRGEKILKFYMAYPSRIFNIFKGGLAYYGGFILGTIAALIFMRMRKMDMLFTSDTIGYGTALGLFFGRIGCFLNGCCFGYQTESFIGVHFPKGSAAFAELANAGIVSRARDLQTPPLIPTQLFEAFFALGLFGYLYFFLRTRKKYDGQIIIQFVIIYAIVRFLLEFLRNDNRGIFLNLLSSSQIISIFLIICALVLRAVIVRQGETDVSKDI
ncbi:MAG: prolipoprotein diacylglyceryl transferase [Deltaproteobacteria bacterium]|nr:prolipoprotein diacylglyceryl transferase [Deltaproteobacteria bacterium]